jgi:cytochrome c553
LTEVSVKKFYFSLPSEAILLAVAVLVAATAAQTPLPTQTPTEPQTPATPLSGSAVPRVYPPPMNLKVLPENLSGKQVHEIMEQWATSLGTHCNTCHAEDRNNIGPNGRPRLDFMDDSKPAKAAARIMFAMTEKINTEYVAKIQGSGLPVTCSTCHRGHLSPEPYVPAPLIPPPPPPVARSNDEGPPAK